MILADPQRARSDIKGAFGSTGEFRGQLKEITKDKRELTVEVWSTLVAQWRRHAAFGLVDQ